MNEHDTPEVEQSLAPIEMSQERLEEYRADLRLVEDLFSSMQDAAAHLDELYAKLGDNEQVAIHQGIRESISVATQELIPTLVKGSGREYDVNLSPEENLRLAQTVAEKEIQGLKATIERAVVV